jgi:predicted transcriptional regulator
MIRQEYVQIFPWEMRSMTNDEILTELGSEAVLNYERITALFYLLMEKGIITQNEFDEKFKQVHEHFDDHLKGIFGDEIEIG